MTTAPAHGTSERSAPYAVGTIASAQGARPARLLFVINALAAGGAERQLVTLASGLERKRFRPEIAVLEPGGRLEHEARACGVPVHAFPRSGRFSFGFLASLGRFAGKFDIVHAWLTPGVLFGLLAGRLGRVPVLVGSERGTGYRHPTRLHGVLMGVEARLLRRCAGVIANSEACRSFAASRGVPDDRLRVVYNALAPDWPPETRSAAAIRAELDVPIDAMVLLSAASLRPKKDHHTLLEAIAELGARGVHPYLLLAGEGPLRGALEARAAELGLAGRVRFLGSRPDVADLLVASDIAVLSSKEREGCSNFLMEAMSLGVPVVATEAGGTREIVGEGRTGLIVPVRRPDRLAGALGALASDAVLRRALGEAAREEAARRFDHVRMIAETTALYESWIHSHRSGSNRERSR